MKKYILIVRNKSNAIISAPLFTADNDQQVMWFIKAHLSFNSLCKGVYFRFNYGEI